MWPSGGYILNGWMRLAVFYIYKNATNSVTSVLLVHLILMGFSGGKSSENPLNMGFFYDFETL